MSYSCSQCGYSFDPLEEEATGPFCDCPRCGALAVEESSSASAPPRLELDVPDIDQAFADATGAVPLKAGLFDKFFDEASAPASEAPAQRPDIHDERTRLAHPYDTTPAPPDPAEVSVPSALTPDIDPVAFAREISDRRPAAAGQPIHDESTRLGRGAAGAGRRNPEPSAAPEDDSGAFPPALDGPDDDALYDDPTSSPDADAGELLAEDTLASADLRVLAPDLEPRALPQPAGTERGYAVPYGGSSGLAHWVVAAEAQGRPRGGASAPEPPEAPAPPLDAPDDLDTGASYDEVLSDGDEPSDADVSYDEGLDDGGEGLDDVSYDEDLDDGGEAFDDPTVAVSQPEMLGGELIVHALQTDVDGTMGAAPDRADAEKDAAADFDEAAGFTPNYRSFPTDALPRPPDAGSALDIVPSGEFKRATFASLMMGEMLVAKDPSLPAQGVSGADLQPLEDQELLQDEAVLDELSDRFQLAFAGPGEAAPAAAPLPELGGNGAAAEASDLDAGPLQSLAPSLEASGAPRFFSRFFVLGLLLLSLLCGMGGAAAGFWLEFAQHKPQALVGRAKARALLTQANQLLHEGEVERAIQVLDMAQGDDASLADIYRALGTAYARKKDFGKAASAYQRYIQLAPGASDAAEVRSILDRYRGLPGMNAPSP